MHVTVRGIRLHVVEEGEGRPVLFVHGLGGNARLWDAQLEDLGRSHHTLAVDLRGFGVSDRTYGEMEIADWADDVAGLLAALGPDPALVVGHSMGGMVAQELATRAPELVAGLVLVDTMPAASERHVDMNLALADLARLEGSFSLARQMVAGCFAPSTVEAGERCVVELERSVAGTDPIVLGIALRAVTRLDVRDRLPHLSVPTLVVSGEHDALLDDCREIARLVPGARLEVVAGAGHCPNLERPDAFTRLVDDFARNHVRWA